MMDDLNLTEDERIELARYLGSYGTPVMDEKSNVHSFLKNIVTADDTTKLGFLSEDELGKMKHPLRTYKNLALISGKIMDNPYFQEYFTAEGEIVTATSLSKEAKLISLAVIQRRQIEDLTHRRKPNKGWFRKKEEDDGVQ